MAKIKKKLKKELVFTIEYRVSAEDLDSLPEILESMRGTGSAEIVDIELEENETDI